jgi:hypothetical protein
MHVRRAADCLFIPDAIGLAGGVDAVWESIEKARFSLNQIEEGFADVPDEWWQASQLDPDDIQEELARRFEALPKILQIQQWGGLNHEQFDNIPIL